MSTYMYLECKDHDPPIQSNDEVGQHTYNLSDIRALIAQRRILVEAINMHVEIDFVDTWARNAAYFFAAHPKCDIGIRDEYGREYDAEVKCDETCYGTKATHIHIRYVETDKGLTIERSA